MTTANAKPLTHAEIEAMESRAKQDWNFMWPELEAARADVLALAPLAKHALKDQGPGNLVHRSMFEQMRQKAADMEKAWRAKAFALDTAESRLAAAEAKVARLEEALRELIGELVCDFCSGSGDLGRSSCATCGGTGESYIAKQARAALAPPVALAPPKVCSVCKTEGRGGSCCYATGAKPPTPNSAKETP